MLNRIQRIRKLLTLIPIFLLSSCVVKNYPVQTIEHPDRVSATIFQVYSVDPVKYYENNWHNPRLCQIVVFDYGETITRKILNEYVFRYVSYTCIGDGYYFMTDYYFDEKLTKKMDDPYTITENIYLYFGCWG